MKYQFSLAALLLTSSLFAQSKGQHCGTKYDPSWETVQFDLARLPKNFAAKSTVSYSIPVVFHVVHDAGPENLSTAVMNNAYNMLNKRFANQSPYYNVDGVSTDISFCLATQDPAGLSTTGIIYHQDEATDFEAYKTDNALPSNYPVDSLIKDVYHWPTDKYLNIYIIRSMGVMTSMGSFPNLHGNFMDGLMITYNTMMAEGLGHEAGHYFGLYHTFQANCTNNDCLNDNDKVCDTPPDILADYNAQTCSINTCTSDEDDISNNNPFRSTTLGGIGDQSDDTKNYMDISACNVKKFTAGQKARMLATLTTIRGSLLTSPGCQPALSTVTIQKDNITVFPNPVADHININGACNSVATLFNSIGQIVVKNNIDSDSYVISVASLHDGVYTLVVNGRSGQQKVTRIVKR